MGHQDARERRGIASSEAAIHDDVPGEFAAVANKATPVGADLVLLEDSEDGFAKKSALQSTLSGAPNQVIVAFDSGDLVSGVLSINHNFGQQFVQTDVYDDSNQEVIPSVVEVVDVNNVDIDLTGLTVNGTWNAVVHG